MTLDQVPSDMKRFSLFVLILNKPIEKNPDTGFAVGNRPNGHFRVFKYTGGHWKKLRTFESRALATKYMSKKAKAAGISLTVLST